MWLGVPVEYTAINMMGIRCVSVRAGKFFLSGFFSSLECVGGGGEGGEG